MRPLPRSPSRISASAFGHRALLDRAWELCATENGDRKLNRAMHTIVVTRMAHDPETRAYVVKRTEGTRRDEIRRFLKRFVARRMYALLEAGPGGLDRPERRPEGVGSSRSVGEILARMREVPAGP